MDEQSKDDSGETEYMWDSTDEQDEEDTKKTAYMWDSMDEQDREDTMDNLKQTDKWVIWKSKGSGPPLCRQRTSTNFSTSSKTSKTISGDLRSKDGGTQETFGSRIPRKSSSVG